MPLARFAIALALGIMTMGFAITSSAADYPDRPVRIVVPFPAGGTLDILARQIASQLETSLKQPFIVENRPGSGGAIGTSTVARAEPDGYTLLLTSINFAVAPVHYRKPPYDPNDLAPVTQLTDSILVLIANTDLPASTLEQIIALAKSKPGALNYGSSGAGSVLELAMELLKIRTGTNIVEVPYRGDAAVIQALTRNDVQLAVVPLAVALPHIQSGRIRAIAVTGKKTASMLPDVKTVEGNGIADYSIGGWHGMFAPAKTDAKIVELIQRETAKALTSPQIRKFLSDNGLEGAGSTPAEFAQTLKSDMHTFATVIRDAKIKQIE